MASARGRHLKCKVCAWNFDMFRRSAVRHNPAWQCLHKNISCMCAVRPLTCICPQKVSQRDPGARLQIQQLTSVFLSASPEFDGVFLRRGQGMEIRACDLPVWGWTAFSEGLGGRNKRHTPPERRDQDTPRCPARPMWSVDDEFQNHSTIANQRVGVRHAFCTRALPAYQHGWLH